MSSDRLSVVVTPLDAIAQQPVIAGTQVTVAQILEKLRDGWFIGDILKEHQLEEEAAINAAVKYAQSLSQEHPLAQLLQQYQVNLKQKVWKIVTQLKQSLQTIYGDRLVQVVLFGSHCRCEAMPDSDIDVLVVLKKPLHWLTESQRISDTVADLSLRYAELVNCCLLDEDEFLHQDEALLRNIRREGIVV